jgi:hypothetical protein
MKLIASLAGLVVVVAGVFALLWFAMPGFQRGFEPAKIIQVKAYLDNRCPLADEAFLAFAPQQNRTARFYDKVAVMRLPEDATIQLTLSNAYPDFQYDDVPQDVAAEVVLTADCSVSPRLRSIFDSMNQQFKQ